MTRYICILTVVLLFGACAVTSQSGAQQNDEKSSESKIRELQQQRRDALQQRYDLIQRRFDDGLLSFDHVVSALDELLKSKLELASSRQEQLNVCKQRIKNLRALEEYAEVKVKVSDGRVEEKHAATAARIQAEIDCLRLESATE